MQGFLNSKINIIYLLDRKETITHDKRAMNSKNEQKILFRTVAFRTGSLRAIIGRFRKRSETVGVARQRASPRRAAAMIVAKDLRGG